MSRERERDRERERERACGRWARRRGGERAHPAPESVFEVLNYKLADSRPCCPVPVTYPVDRHTL